jgi:capsular exopolysaccharide synthesis family protein
MIPKPDENLPAPVAEAYRTLRTNLAYTAEKEQKRVFGVTSAATGDGKSVLTANLAIVYTQLGKRVLVLEADMRKPSMAQLFGAEAKVGLAEVLTGLVTDYQEALLHQNGVDVLTAGALPYNPAELLAGERMQTLVNEAREAYDLVLVDLPAMGEVSDAAVVAPLTDGYLVAVHAAYTDSRALRSTLEEMGLVSMQTIGFVLVGAGK